MLKEKFEVAAQRSQVCAHTAVTVYPRTAPLRCQPRSSAADTRCRADARRHTESTTNANAARKQVLGGIGYIIRRSGAFCIES